jgi:hypothetical protein
MVATLKENCGPMNFSENIKQLLETHFADARRPDITGLVDDLFDVAAESGSVACVLDDGDRLHFFLSPPPTQMHALVPSVSQMQSAYVMRSNVARTYIRMICARLAVICKDRGGTDVSPYGDQAVIGDSSGSRKRWHVSFTNAPERQSFLIKSVSPNLQLGRRNCKSDS